MNYHCEKLHFNQFHSPYLNEILMIDNVFYWKLKMTYFLNAFVYCTNGQELCKFSVPHGFVKSGLIEKTIFMTRKKNRGCEIQFNELGKVRTLVIEGRGVMVLMVLFIYFQKILFPAFRYLNKWNFTETFIMDVKVHETLFFAIGLIWNQFLR